MKIKPKWEIEFDKKFADPVQMMDHKCSGEIVESFVWADRVKRFIRKVLKESKT